jgi:hypothetical protein
LGAKELWNMKALGKCLFFACSALLDIRTPTAPRLAELPALCPLFLGGRAA